MDQVRFKLKAKIWLYKGGKAAWHFITLGKKESAAIAKHDGIVKHGWGSVKVIVRLGESVWSTSIFPDRASGTYFLPLKASVRKKEDVHEGDTVTFTLEINMYNRPAPKKKGT